MIELGCGGFTPLTLEQAFALQHRLVETIRLHLDGEAQLQAGDYGVSPSLNRPKRTAEVEAILSDFFEAEAAALVRGAGTGAIRMALSATIPPGSTVLVHQPPTYPTTLNSFESMGLQPASVDFNDLDAVAHALRDTTLAGVLVQHTYQSDDDCYSVEALVNVIRQNAPQLPIICDDNYAAFKVARIGCQQDADVSAFSLFKLLGPEGVGLVVGRQAIIDRIHRMNYSGGSQVQGPEAMEALQSLTFAPVVHASAAQVIRELLERAPAEIPTVKLRISLIQGVHLVAQFDQPIGEQVAEAAAKHGALPWPVGAESRYELSPLFYRMSATFRQRYPEQARSMIRILPMRAGADTILNILRAALADAGYNR
jgi:dTDP-4-amino-4,6-dideoxygalactose transaminase